MIFKLAWRNIWRNRRRSLITISSILFAVFFAVAMRAIQLGTYDRVIDNVVNSFTGYIQVHKKGYWDDQVLDNAMELNTLPEDLKEQIEGVEAVFPRIQGFALVATEQKTKGAAIIALDPDQEDGMLGLSDKLVGGTLMGANDQALMIGEGLARSLDVQPQDTLVLLGQGYQSMSAAGKYVVAGLLKYPSPQMNNSIVLMPFSVGQELFSAYGLATSLVVQIDEPQRMQAIQRQVEALADTAYYETMNWRAMLPELVQSIQADSSGGIIMVMILYLVIMFGIFGTLLMMINERQYEFGVLLSIGLNRTKLTAIMLVEMVILAFMGVAAGALVAYPLQYYFNVNPIQLTGQMAETIEAYGWEAVMAASIDPAISFAHASGVLLLTLLISLYAVFHLKRLEPVAAMRK